MKARNRPIRSPTASTTRTRWSRASGWRTICASPSPTGIPSPGRAAIRSAARPSSGRGSATRWSTAKLKADVAFEMFSLLGVPYFCFHDADVRPEGKNFAESAARLDEIADYFAKKHEADRRQAAVGHGQPVLAPPLHGGRGHQSRSGCVRLCGRDGEDLHGRRPSGSAARTTCCGAAAKATRRCSTPTSSRELRPGRPLPQPGRRLQAQDRLQGHDPDRAEAAGADQAPVRLRRRDGLRLPQAATGWRRR